MRGNAQNFRLALAFLAVAVAPIGCGTSAPVSSTMPSNSASGSKGVASGPFFGAWWDPGTRAVRTVYGVSGAAVQGLPSYGGGAWTGAFICMRRNLALLTDAAGALSLASLPNGQPAGITSQIISKPQVVFSPSCSSALVYSSGTANALLIQGLPATPSVHNVTLPAAASSPAVADSGAVLFAVAQADGTAAIQLLSTGSTTLQPVMVLTKPGGIAFLPAADSALLADAGTSTVTEASQLTGNLSLTRIAGTTEGITQPVAIAVSADGRSTVIVNHANSTIVRIDLSGQRAAAQSACNCTPSELVPLAGNLVFRLNEAGSGTVWAYDGDATAPRFAFIPTDQTATAAQGAHP
jgi:hypothetical protein